MSLRVAFITETYPPEVNGVAMTVGRLVDGLRQRGHQVTVIRPRQREGDTGAGDDIVVRGLPILGYPGLRFGLPARSRLRRLWSERRPDLVHVVTEGPIGWSAVSAARRLGIPTTSGFHTNFDRYSVHYGLGWLRPMVAAYLRALHRRTRATLVPTETLAAELAGEGIPGVRVVGRGVDTVLYDPGHRSDTLRHQWNCTPRDLVCLYVGRLAPEKNLDLVCRTFAAINARRPDSRLVWVGDGPARRQLEALHPDHCFAGMQVGENLARHYASGDLFIFPSLTETYGNVVPEAMASGLPVVAYRSAAAAQLIVDGISGRSVPAGDEQALVAAAVELATDDFRRSLIGEAARRAMLPLAWEVVVQRLECVMHEAAGRDASSPGGWVRQES